MYPNVNFSRKVMFQNLLERKGGQQRQRQQQPLLRLMIRNKKDREKRLTMQDQFNSQMEVMI
jgi:hypothetical protein